MLSTPSPDTELFLGRSLDIPRNTLVTRGGSAESCAGTAGIVDGLMIVGGEGVGGGGDIAGFASTLVTQYPKDSLQGKAKHS